MKTKLISLLIVLGITSCSDFLEVELEGTYTTANFYKTEAHALLALTAVYNQALFTSTNNNLWVFGDVASDDATKGGAAGDQNDIQFIDEFSYSRNNTALEKIWKHYYEGITRANYLLYYGADIQMDESRKARILSEAKFMRAFFYFSLVNIFGEIPLKLNPPINPEEANVAKSPVSNVYAQIEKDLQEASAGLETTYTGADEGRATQGASFGLLAKAYLYQQKYEQALTAIASLESLGMYQLDNHYKNNFIDSTQNNSEIIFKIGHLAGQSPSLGSHLVQYFSPAVDNGYFFNQPLQNFVDEFEKTDADVVDPRLDYTVGRAGQPWVDGDPFDTNWSPTGYLQRKQVQPTRELVAIGDADLDYVYLRYADILLMKAEALNETNKTAEALVPLNAVRKRARESYLYDEDLTGFGVVPADLLPDVASASQVIVRDAIRHERRVELGFEFHRYFDLMRYGQTVAESALSDTGFNYAQHRYFPIPLSEIDTNSLINE